MSEPLTQDYVTPWTVYNTDGVQVAFAYPWFVQSAAELKAYLNNILTTDYTVSGVGSATGGTLTFFAPPPPGILVLVRQTPQTQDNELIGNTVSNVVLASMYNKVTRLVQDQEETFSRIPQFAVGISSPYRDMQLPAPVPGVLLGYDSNGQLTTYPPTVRQVVPDPVSNTLHGKTTVTLQSSLYAGLDTMLAVGLFPPGVRGIGVMVRVTTPFSLSNGLTSVAVGTADFIDAWGDNVMAINTTPFTDAQGRTYYARNLSAQWRLQPYFGVESAMSVFVRANTGRFAATGTMVVTALWADYYAD